MEIWASHETTIFILCHLEPHNGHSGGIWILMLVARNFSLRTIDVHPQAVLVEVNPRHLVSGCAAPLYMAARIPQLDNSCGHTFAASVNAW